MAFNPMDDDEERPTLSWRDLATREEAGLAFPGSRLVEEGGYDEGEGWFDPSVLKGAGLYRGYLSDADGNEVHEWFRTQLANRGWEVVARPPSSSGDDDAFYARGSERFAVRVLGHDSDFAPGDALAAAPEEREGPLLRHHADGRSGGGGRGGRRGIGGGLRGSKGRCTPPNSDRGHASSQFADLLPGDFRSRR